MNWRSGLLIDLSPSDLKYSTPPCVHSINLYSTLRSNDWILVLGQVRKTQRNLDTCGAGAWGLGETCSTVVEPRPQKQKET